MIDFIYAPVPLGHILRTSQPGFYRMSAAMYHADPVSEPSLSSSLALTLIQETPAHARIAHPRLTPPDDEAIEKAASKQMELGSVVHELVLGCGGGYEVLKFKDYRSDAAKQARDNARGLGKTPILADKFDEALEIADAIVQRCTEIDGLATALELSESEPVFIWRDIGGVWCRVMCDKLHITENQATFHDIKTTARGISDGELQSRIEGGLSMRAAFYCRGAEQLLPHLAGRIKFRWIFVEVDPPYEVRVVEATGEQRDLGDRQAAYAIEVWRRCTESGRWPGYPRKIEHLPTPPWAETKWLAREMSEAGESVALASHPLSRGRPVPERLAAPNVMGAG